MKIAIRTDASPQIGMGHFMRCLTLADALAQQGSEIRFISRYLTKSLRNMLEARAFDFTLLDVCVDETIKKDKSHAGWLGTSQTIDAQDTLQVLSGRNWDIMVVDHYSLDACWESEVRQATKKVLVIDDLANRQHDCDILVDQNYYVDALTRYNGLVSKDCDVLTGPKYSLLRNEFSEVRRKLHKRDGSISRILVFYGGSDLENQTLKTLQALQNLKRQKIAIDVIIGLQNPYRNDLEMFASVLDDVTTHFNVSNMSELIANADLYIGAAGTTTWERCCLGLPSLVITVAPNQVQATRDLEHLGVLSYLGESSSVTNEQIIAAVTGCLSAPLWMMELSGKGLALVDGRGASRCVDTIIQLTKSTKQNHCHL